MRDKTVTVLGLGGLGAPIALDLARGGVGALRLIDHDIVDAATTIRWPLGVSVAEQQKVVVIRDFIVANYPYTTVDLFVPARLGSPRTEGDSELDLLDRVMESALIVDATAETGAQDAIAELARNNRVPYLAAWATPGCWGGFVARVLPERSGCWQCVRHCLDDGTIHEPNEDPNGNLQPIGCADPTFTGTSFDLAAVAGVATRLAVSTLSSGYANTPWDLAVIEIRDGDAITGPFLSQTLELQRHPNCAFCQ